MAREIEFKCPRCGSKAFYYGGGRAACILHGWLLYTEIPSKVYAGGQKPLYNYRAWYIISAILMAVLIFQIESTTLLSYNVDWNETYYPAIKLLLTGQNPYGVTTLHNPVWGLIPLIPIALLGERIGGAVLFFLAFASYAFVSYKLSGSQISTMIFLLSPLVVYNLMLGNIDWMIVVGFILPPWAGLFLVLLKPQIGIAAAAYWAWESYKDGGVGRVVKVFVPVTIALVISFLVYGNWLTGKSDNLLNAPWNMSLFPYSIPIGIILLYLSSKNKNRALSASPMFSPYLNLGSWSIAQLGIVDNMRINFAVTFLLWLVYLYGSIM